LKNRYASVNQFQLKRNGVAFKITAKKKVTRKELLRKDDEFISFSARALQYVSAHLGKIQYEEGDGSILFAIYTSGLQA